MFGVYYLENWQGVQFFQDQAIAAGGCLVCIIWRTDKGQVLSAW